jgi:GMP synthase (glutamine-hydrolysing)
MGHSELPVFGLQFHPEVSHTPQGWRMLTNFAKICGLEVGSWDAQGYLRSKEEEISKAVGEGVAMVAVSGGVDSTVAAVLALRSLRDRLVTVHVDHGFMRLGESERVVSELRGLGLNPILVEASTEFLGGLAGVEDADSKRRLVGRLFIEIFERIAGERSVTHLIQGTIAPDAIESSRGQASKGMGSSHGGMIKLHHNVGALPAEMWIPVLEPIRDLFKYQVRILGRELGVPNSLLDRQPFPGPGLSVRVQGSVDRDTMGLLRTATAMVESGLSPYRPAQYLVYLIDSGLEGCPQAEGICREALGEGFSVLAALHGAVAVGVKGDERHLGRILSLRLEEGGGSDWDQIPWLDVLRLQSALTGRLRDVCRVVASVAEGQNGDLAAVVRAVDTRDFMTAMPTKVPFTVLEGIGRRLLDLDRIRSVYYEITTKPSSTIELE